MSRNLHVPGSCNPSANPDFAEILSRRSFLKAGVGAAALAVLPACSMPGTSPRIGFTPIAPSGEDLLRVPPEYDARVLYRWGDPVGAAAGMPEFRMDGSNSAADQALQAGMHHDGMHYFPLEGSTRGLLAMNHEYMDEGLLFPDGMRTWSADKVAKAQNAVGVSVIEVILQKNHWEVVRPSRSARRITASTPCRVAGPAAGHALMRTAANPDGRMVLGTYAGCAHGWTPWGTYLTCEENWHVYFSNSGGAISADQARYRMTPRGRNTRWDEHDERFNAARHPNEFNRFGWVVEIDPFDPLSVPVKRTALGRFMHEGAACSVGVDRRLAFYLGDDEAFEYIYKFVTARPYDSSSREKNRDLLDDGVLYAARFNADGTGDWLPLTGPDQGEVRVRTRQAADAAGATRMDRPEWIVPHPVTREVFAALTNNSARRQPAPGNPRAPNPYGHILRWREEDDDVASGRFRWEVFVLAGPEGHGTIKGDAFACPDGLWIDAMGTLWIQTDVSPTALGRGPLAALGNNQTLAVDPSTGVFRRFLTGPRGCEITGFHTTPDNRSAFVNILRWREEDDDVASRRFRWEVFVLAGPKGHGTIKGDAFACPDGLWIDAVGTLWVQTDVSPTALGRGPLAALGNNQMLAVDPSTGVFRRFLTGPRGCEITGFHTTPDNRSAFVNIQHPGETPGDRSNPDNPRAFSNWPDYAPNGRPRSATVVIRRKDGGVIGT